MFSLDNFYHTLYINFFNDTIARDVSFYPFGSTDIDTMSLGIYYNLYHAYKPFERINVPIVVFYDQEPIQESIIDKFRIVSGVGTKHDIWCDSIKRLRILANSEKSPAKDNACDYWLMEDWYYFFHGFAALDWYRDFQYAPKFDNSFSKVFICLNRLCTKDRSYRLTLVSKILSKNIQDKGLLSLALEDLGTGTWQEELKNPYTKLSTESKQLVEKYIGKLPGSLVVDKSTPPGHSSAESSPEVFNLYKTALWHVVTETVFYHDKLHLTEKIFKPIVSRRPFILVAAPGNLNYLKSYGFKTFDKWIDESYDLEKDHDKRLELIVNELEKLSLLPYNALVQMHAEMDEILDYNFNHFYGEFKNIIVDEMVNNLEAIFARWNNGRFDDREYDISNINFQEIKKRLKS